MQTALKSAATTPGEKSRAEPVKFLKRVGSTIFVVSVHFSGTSKESMGDKVLRLIEKEAASR